MMENDSKITIRLSEDLKSEFNQLAREMGWTSSQLAREAFKYFIIHKDEIKKLWYK